MNKSTRIVPGILEESYLSIQTHVGLVKDYVTMVQLDICDGLFVKKTTWPYSMKDTAEYTAILEEGDGLPSWRSVNYELDLMVKNAHKKFFSDWIKLGPSRIVFHFEAENSESFLLFLQELDFFYKEEIKIGIAISLSTNPELLTPFIEHISFVQCMGIETIGVQGASFSKDTITQVQKVRELYPHTLITVDGGVNFSSIKELASLGVNRYVVGSAVFSAFDIEKTITELDEVTYKNVIE